MKNIIAAFTALLAFVFLSFISLDPSAAQENKDEQNKPRREEDLSKEDKEIIENIELLKNLDLLMKKDIEMIRNLEIFMANS